MAHGPWKKPLDFDGNTDQVTLVLALRLGGSTTILCIGYVIIVRRRCLWWRYAFYWVPFFLLL